MINIYKLEDNFRFRKYDTWDDGKFSGPLSDLDIKESEVEKRFNTSYYRTENVKAAESKSDDKPDDKPEAKDKPTEKFEIDIREL